MTIGKIQSTQTFDDNRVFSGLDITAEFLNEKGYRSELKFRYAYFTNDLSGKVQSVLNSLFNNKPLPKNVSNVVVD